MCKDIYSANKITNFLVTVLAESIEHFRGFPIWGNFFPINSDFYSYVMNII